MVRRARRLALVQPLPVGLGVGGQHAAAALEALHVARRHAHAADRALAARHRGARRGARPVRARDRPHADGARRRAASTRPSTVDGVTQQPFDGASDPRHVRRRRARRHRARVQYFEMLGSRSIVSDGWKATTDHVSQGRRRRGATPRGEPRLRRPTRGRCSASPTTSPRPTTSPTSIPTSLRALQERLARPKPAATRCSRSSTS